MDFAQQSFDHRLSQLESAQELQRHQLHARATRALEEAEERYQVGTVDGSGEPGSSRANWFVPSFSLPKRNPQHPLDMSMCRLQTILASGKTYYVQYSWDVLPHRGIPSVPFRLQTVDRNFGDASLVRPT